MQLKTSFLIALTISVIGLISWELYWRSQGYEPTLDDNKHLWAVERAKVDKLSSDDVILTGSSRVLFDIQLDEFEKVTGIRPIQLASAGSSPLPIFHDIVEHTNFAGTIIVGVTPPLFFSTTFPQAGPWQRPQKRVDHFHKRTYAHRLNHWLSVPLQQNLVMMSGHEEDADENIDLKGLLKRLKLPERTGKPQYPAFFEFGTIDIDRNMRMTEKTVSDTAFANIIKNAWKFIITSKGPAPDIEGTTKFFVTDAQKFMARGGNLILLRPPSSGMFKGGESQFFPREQLYDQLVKATGAKSYHYEDYDQLRDMICPEWSHLSGEDADTFTRVIAEALIKDNALTKSNL
ncbi:MAG: hypothetical protein HKN40_01175 [Winogradskyella sp.]|uniref:hypothetical protein n=1 Tax=Winogradskyella sp. TaxID=1883156 RepID=UPI001808AD13|nr:hypothetical protein [Winogradskyella sp.]